MILLLAALLSSVAGILYLVLTRTVCARAPAEGRPTGNAYPSRELLRGPQLAAQGRHPPGGLLAEGGQPVGVGVRPGVQQAEQLPHLLEAEPQRLHLHDHPQPLDIIALRYIRLLGIYSNFPIISFPLKNILLNEKV